MLPFIPMIQKGTALSLLSQQRACTNNKLFFQFHLHHIRKDHLIIIHAYFLEPPKMQLE